MNRFHRWYCRTGHGVTPSKARSFRGPSATSISATTFSGSDLDRGSPPTS